MHVLLLNPGKSVEDWIVEVVSSVQKEWVRFKTWSVLAGARSGLEFLEVSPGYRFSTHLDVQ
jgi:hypothetical protein